MIKEERQQMILEILSKSKKIDFPKLSSMLSVSYDSVRRDVIELQDKGLLKKVHGGVVSNSYLNILAGQRKNIHQSSDLDLVINKALTLILPGQILLIDGGTTNFFLAEKIPKNIPLTIITNSPPLAMVLNEHDLVEVILLGGTYYKRYQITMGAEVNSQISNFNVDLFFMGINGIDQKKGLTIRNYEESLMKKLMMKISKQTVCCVVEEKIGLVESFQICNTPQISTLITNLDPTHEKIKSMEVSVIM